MTSQNVSVNTEKMSSYKQLVQMTAMKVSSSYVGQNAPPNKACGQASLSHSQSLDGVRF